MDLDGLVADDHPVRMIWNWVERVDMTSILDAYKARGSAPGRAAIDPRILLCLWLYATSESIGSARLIARLCGEHNAYRWILGGVSINHHTLSEFRTTQTGFLDQLLTNSLAALVHQGIVRLETVAQDGMRVRACAGRSSLRKRAKLEQLQQQCRTHVEELKKELESNPDAASARQRAARQRAARERQERIDAALASLEQMEKRSQKIQAKQGKKSPPPEGPEPQDKSKQPKPPRASTSDPECERMKMANGGFDPAYNVQYVTDAQTRMIVGVEVTGRGSDYGMMGPLMEQLFKRYGKRAGAVLADSGYTDLQDITATEKAGTQVHVPLKKPGEPPSARTLRKDTQQTRAWRNRMATQEAQELLKTRGSLAEWANAQARNHGLTRLLVRGLRKVRSVALLHALTINLGRMQSLGAI
jgi:transposase